LKQTQIEQEKVMMKDLEKMVKVLDIWKMRMMRMKMLLSVKLRIWLEGERRRGGCRWIVRTKKRIRVLGMAWR
jgi:hypothetical protein